MTSTLTMLVAFYLVGARFISKKTLNHWNLSLIIQLAKENTPVTLGCTINDRSDRAHNTVSSIQ